MDLIDDSSNELEMSNITPESTYKQEIMERMARKMFKAKGYALFQPNWIAFKNGQNFIIDVKCKKGPYITKHEGKQFKGFSLSEIQIKSRMAFYRSNDIRIGLYFYDLKAKNVYFQWLDFLEDKGIGIWRTFFNEKHKVYPIDAFNLIDAQTYFSSKLLNDIKHKILGENVGFENQDFID